MRLDIEWHIPFPEDWPPEKCETAREHMLHHITNGTFFDSKSRMRVTSAEIRGAADMRFITFTLEN